MIVKVCGITSVQDAKMCGAAGVDWIGINFWPQSKRYVGDLHLAQEIAQAAVSSGVHKVVGVFVNQENLLEVREQVGLHFLQCHGDEPSEFVRSLAPWGAKALSVRNVQDLKTADSFGARWVLLDTPCDGYGGSGTIFDWSILRGAQLQTPFLLAGGLTAENVADAITVTQPFGVDVASGVELQPGKKDPVKVKEFVRRAKG